MASSVHPTGGKLRVTILASEWGSSKGGLSTINRELAIQLAKWPEVEITFFLPPCSEEDKNAALSHNIKIVKAARRAGYEELDWLSFPPDDLQIDVIVGHGVKLGRQAQVIREVHKCKWIQVVHTYPEQLAIFKSYENPISKGENKHKLEVKLCEMADFVVGVGPKIREAFRSYFRWRKKDPTILTITPGVFNEFLDVKHAAEERKRCGVLVFGHGDAEDFQLKGFDIAGKAVAQLDDARLCFVGAPEGKHEEIARRLLECGIPAHRLTVRGFLQSREELKRLFCEVDLVLMPSRTEGFGLTGLEALSAGLPVLVSKNSGFGEALLEVPFGSSCVIDSQDAKVWADAIKKIWNKDRETRLQEAEVLRSSYEKKYSWDKQSPDLVTKMISITNRVPAEILARGPLAVNAYNKALEQGATRVMRVPIMFIGQERSGKTSLKKSVRGQKFNQMEDSTDGIEKDPSYFSVSTEIWSTGESHQPDSESAMSLPNRIAQFMVADLRGEENRDIVAKLSDGQSKGYVTSSKSAESQYRESNRDTGAPTAKQDSDFSEQPKDQSEELLVGSLLPKFNEKESKDIRAEKQKIPSATAACVEKLLLQSDRKDEDKVYSILWDFGGQSVYYVTHPLFLTTNAVYLLVYDLSRNPHDRATPIVKQGIFKQKEDQFCKKTNEDYLHFWLSSVSSLAGQSKSHSQTEDGDSGKLSKRLPPVILVCTHADKCDRASEVAREIYGSLSDKTKPYREHLLKKFFTVDNTKSGSAHECPEVKRLREEILAVVKQLPQVKQIIPIKWLKFEEALKSKSENGEPFVTLDDAKKIANEECKITDDQQFNTLMNFLHDQRILIHFDDTPELARMVILDLQWLIDLFKRVITVKSYDPTANDEQFEELWEKLENEGILDDELLQIVWRPLLKNEAKETTVESLIDIMEKFSLLCHWPSEEKSKQYLVPSMLRSHPGDSASKLLSSAVLPPLFIRFTQSRPLNSSQRTSDVKSGEECMYVQVPVGLFPRLVVKFVQWCTKGNNKPSPMYKHMYQNFARFPIHSPEGYSVILLCHSFSVEIVVHRDLDAEPDTSGLSIGRTVRSQLESMLQRMRKEFFWLNSMEYEFCVLCPICCNQRLANYCRRHDKNGCDKEECLHFWSESNLQKEQFCTGDTFAERTRVPVAEFVPWFQFACMEQEVDKFLLSCGDILVKDAVVMNIHIMDKLACLLDQPICHGNQEVPTAKYWLHLAEEFEVSNEVKIRCQLNPDNSPSKNMLDFQEARDPQFKVQILKEGLRDINRNDLEKKLEECSLPDTSTIRDLRVDHTEIFETICLQLDYHKNWKALGQKIDIPHDTLEQISTSASCTNTVLDIIEKNKPNLTVKEMQTALREMQRGDVSTVLDKLPGESTIATLRENLECLEVVTTLLDKETPGSKNWLHFAKKFGISKEKCDNLKPKGTPSPTKQLMEYIVQVNPECTLAHFIQTLVKLQRHDVVNALKQFFSGPQAAAEEGFHERDIENVTAGVQDLSLEKKKALRK